AEVLPDDLIRLCEHDDLPVYKFSASLVNFSLVCIGAVRPCHHAASSIALMEEAWRDCFSFRR
ncbi:MAG: hypothetical protein DYG96_16275, partial [Chlorobi bacterium CHB2]|nr:hypothetical protein [Chlorobi bacterium CHB2]